MQLLAVISALLNNNMHEIHNAASTCRDWSGKYANKHRQSLNKAISLDTMTRVA